MFLHSEAFDPCRTLFPVLESWVERRKEKPFSHVLMKKKFFFSYKIGKENAIFL